MFITIGCEDKSTSFSRLCFICFRDLGLIPFICSDISISGTPAPASTPDAFSTTLFVLRLPFTRPSNVNSPISVVTFDSDAIPKNLLHLYLTLIAMLLAASLTLPAILLIPLTNPPTIFLPMLKRLMFFNGLIIKSFTLLNACCVFVLIDDQALLIADFMPFKILLTLL